MALNFILLNWETELGIEKDYIITEEEAIKMQIDPISLKAMHQSAKVDGYMAWGPILHPGLIPNAYEPKSRHR